MVELNNHNNINSLIFKENSIMKPSPRSNTNGFTLIELMVTIAIIAIVAGIAIPSYNGYITTAKMAEAENNLAAIRLAQEEFFLENNRYFSGANAAAIKTDSGDLWTVSKGSDGYNFDYVVTLSSGWTATATGKIGKKVAGKTRTTSKE
jgi:type IV pilus assembly protein PilE